MTTPEGKEIKYNYDVNHRLTQIFTDVLSVIPAKAGIQKGKSNGTGGQSFSFAYDIAGRRTKLTYPNGVTTNYTYDSIGRLTNLLTQSIKPAKSLRGKAEAILIDSFTYTHDKIGNRLSKAETSSPSPLEGEGGVRGNKYDYSYDTIYRLLQSMPVKTKHNEKEDELENKSEVFTYDPVGNRLTGPKDKLNYTYNEGNQLMSFLRKQESREGEATSKDKEDYTYDKNGNLIKKVELDDDGQIKKTTLYTYDYENRLTKVEMTRGVILSGAKNLKVATFTYDPFGRRLSKSVSHLSLRGEGEAISEEDDDNDDNDKDDEEKEYPRTTYYVYDNEDIIMEYNHKGKVTARYIHGLGIDEPLAVERKGKAYYYHFDGLGSVTALTDAKGKVVQRYEYDSFGKLKRLGNKVKNSYTRKNGVRSLILIYGKDYDRYTSWQDL